MWSYLPLSLVPPLPSLYISTPPYSCPTYSSTLPSLSTSNRQQNPAQNGGAGVEYCGVLLLAKEDRSALVLGSPRQGRVHRGLPSGVPAATPISRREVAELGNTQRRLIWKSAGLFHVKMTASPALHAVCFTNSRLKAVKMH